MIDASAGLTFFSVGGEGSVEGSWRAAAAIADCTSWAAASMFRSSENWIVIDVLPDVDADVIESTPAIVENCFSSGVATAEAIVSGLAPGSVAETWIVGKSTFGSAFTGSSRYATMPKIRIPIITSAVITGRRTKRAAMFIRDGFPKARAPRRRRCRQLRRDRAGSRAGCLRLGRYLDARRKPHLPDW